VVVVVSSIVVSYCKSDRDGFNVELGEGDIPKNPTFSDLSSLERAKNFLDIF
jgi:hypothetical protein